MVRKKAAKIKMFMSRTVSYLGLINAGMILFLVLSRLEDYGIDIDIEQYFFPILLSGFIILIIFGWIDDKLGLHELEREHAEDRSIYLNTILKKLNDIENRIK